MVPVYFDPVVLRHHTGAHHPESAARLARCVQILEAGGVTAEAPATPARTLRAIERVHSRPYVFRLRETCIRAPAEAAGNAFGLFGSPDNPMSAATFESALRTVGLVLAASDAVLEGRARSVFVAARPPGHHATVSRAMGFCFFNTAAVAAMDLLETRSVERVLVADFDVHHGNGTQELFWEDGRVAYLSVHRYPFYPGTGAADEEGAGRGRGSTLNVPVGAGAGDERYAEDFVAALERLAARFRPEVVLVSAGFDAHVEDPAGGMRVTEGGFHRMTRALRQVADVFAGGRIVSLLEGGYRPEALGRSALTHLKALAG